jgi:hypothetical protein
VVQEARIQIKLVGLDEARRQEQEAEALAPRPGQDTAEDRRRREVRRRAVEVEVRQKAAASRPGRLLRRARRVAGGVSRISEGPGAFVQGAAGGGWEALLRRFGVIAGVGAAAGLIDKFQEQIKEGVRLALPKAFAEATGGTLDDVAGLIREAKTAGGGVIAGVKSLRETAQAGELLGRPLNADEIARVFDRGREVEEAESRERGFLDRALSNQMREAQQRADADILVFIGNTVREMLPTYLDEILKAFRSIGGR